MTEAQDSRIDLGNGIIRETYQNGHLIAYSGGEATRAAIDTWFADVVAHFKDYQAGETYAALYDFSHPKAALTPYARSRALEIARLVPKNTQNYAALVVRSGIMGQAYQLFMRGAFPAPHLQSRVFFTREEAMGWLLERLNKAK